MINNSMLLRAIRNQLCLDQTPVNRPGIKHGKDSFRRLCALADLRKEPQQLVHGCDRVLRRVEICLDAARADTRTQQAVPIVPDWLGDEEVC